ncbi:MAG: dTDP-4-dehydrorhamnose reductase [Pseudobdellovibrio sp.]
MKALIFGSNGQLACEFKKKFEFDKEIYQVGSSEVDFLKPDQITKLIKEFKPKFIINCSAYTAVDKAESDQATALQINGFALGVMGEAAKKVGATVIHYSTDYVFNGESKIGYNETDKVDPINYYGYSKLIGENNLRETCDKHLIFRVSWVYGIYGNNFLKTILRLAKERLELKIVHDQHGAPTSSSAIAEATLRALADPEVTDKAGLYHMSPHGNTSWYGFTEKILELTVKEQQKFKIITESVIPITSDQFPSAAKRPKNSLLLSKKLMDTFQIELPEWSESLKLVLKAL